MMNQIIQELVEKGYNVIFQYNRLQELYKFEVYNDKRHIVGEGLTPEKAVWNCLELFVKIYGKVE
ncbi:hypothetical protein PQE70_gp242 [Bacillus phage vB_BanS_Nate]|uniref:Uncharacterized protein n=1 Tax=Bacillus phage vB_BanS_Nate TaxID=2894788 RepID=A0AAE8YW44_9CAUD|nr:hypothetical protein PQE70_gp242 [Bacillus phage vB_BanS_Nate]UGO51116.1 hypothetical protein NATE_282 [Bacillus phage vB_BanS_Nate]